MMIKQAIFLACAAAVLPTWAAEPLLSFAQAAAKAVDVASCPPTRLVKIGYASASPVPAGDPAAGFMLWIAASKESESPVEIGPLKDKPTDAELASLHGQPMCDTSD
ncbi:MAG: hypothetical protein JO142_03225 [Burkholderiales bacterium]|nr:hypothetical protein [Burkholderiales bacterium]